MFEIIAEPNRRAILSLLVSSQHSQGAVSHKHLAYYLDEFTFRFNRRRSKSRGKVFFRLAQQAVRRRSCYPSPDRSPALREDHSQTTRYRGYLSQPDTHLVVFQTCG